MGRILGVVVLDDLRFRLASAADFDSILELLRRENLPTAGVDEHIQTFIVGEQGGRIVACGGAEAHQNAALLRSIAVAPAYRGLGIGRRVVRELLDRLSARGLREFYLLTTTAEDYFRMHGFWPVNRDEVDPQLLASAEFQGACPSSAVCMRLVVR